MSDQPTVTIRTVLLPGGVLAQGPMLRDGKPDARGLVSVDAGGTVATGRLVESLRA